MMQILLEFYSILKSTIANFKLQYIILHGFIEILNFIIFDYKINFIYIKYIKYIKFQIS